MVPDFRLATQLNNRAALDAAMTLLLHLVNHWRRASERGRRAKNARRL